MAKKTQKCGKAKRQPAARVVLRFIRSQSEDRSKNKGGHFKRLITASSTESTFSISRRILDTEDTFDEVIFSNKFPISLQQFNRTCYRKFG